MITVTEERETNRIKTLVAQTVAEILNDPDFGLELSAKAKKRLGQALPDKQKTISLSVLKQKYV